MKVTQQKSYPRLKIAKNPKNPHCAVDDGGEENDISEPRVKLIFRIQSHHDERQNRVEWLRSSSVTSLQLDSLFANRPDNDREIFLSRAFDPKIEI